MVVPEAWKKSKYTQHDRYVLLAFRKQVQFWLDQVESGSWSLTCGMELGKRKEVGVLADGPDLLARASEAVVSYMLLEVGQVREIADRHQFPQGCGTVWDRLLA